MIIQAIDDKIAARYKLRGVGLGQPLRYRLDLDIGILRRELFGSLNGFGLADILRGK